jgi:hypothetical protein
MTPELQQEMSVLLSPPLIAGFITWLVTQIVMIIFMIRHKPRNRKVEEAVRRGHMVKTYIAGRVYEKNRPEEGTKWNLRSHLRPKKKPGREGSETRANG